jgi:hypothetical protein
MSVPFVAGSAALLLAADPTLKSNELKRLLMDGAVSLPGACVGPLRVASMRWLSLVIHILACCDYLVFACIKHTQICCQDWTLALLFPTQQLVTTHAVLKFIMITHFCRLGR